MERSFRYLFVIMAMIPLLFLLIATIFYLQSGRGTLPSGSYVFLDPTSIEGRLGIFLFRLGKLLWFFMPAVFFIMFAGSLVTYLVFRKQLSRQHFNLQSVCYLPFLILVLMMHLVDGNPVMWFIEYLMNTN
jgi:hypothetical protein